MIELVNSPDKQIESSEDTIFQNPICKSTYQALPKIYGNSNYQRKKIQCKLPHIQPPKHCCIHLQHQHLQSQKQDITKSAHINVSYSAQRLSQPKITRCNKKHCYCNLNLQEKKVKTNHQRDSSANKDQKKLPPLISIKELQPDDMESQHKVFTRTPKCGNLLSPSGLDILLNYHRPNFKNKTQGHDQRQQPHQTKANIIIKEPQNENKTKANHQKHQKIQNQKYASIQSNKNNQKDEKQINIIKNKKKIRQINRRKKYYNDQASESNSYNEGDSGIDNKRHTKKEQSKRSDSRSSVSISNLVFQTKKDHTMFHENDKKAEQLVSRSKVKSLKSNGLFTIPQQVQYASYLKNYKPLNSNFKLKKLLQKSNFKIIKEQNVVYFGQVQNKVKNGEGILIAEKQIYQGKWINNNRVQGFERNIDGVYEGGFVNGLREGKGIFRWNNGEVFEGMWSEGSKNGYGVWTSPKGDKYQGQWIKNRQHGQGVFKHKNNIYKGQFKNFLKHGKGQQWFSNGHCYMGQYEEGKPHGKGIYKWSDGGEYVGYFVNGLMEGQGKWTESNGTVYQGHFRKDFKDGLGMEIYKTGQKFIGIFQQGAKKKGKMYGAHGDVIQIQ